MTLQFGIGGVFIPKYFLSSYYVLDDEFQHLL